MFDVGAIVGSLILDDKFSAPMAKATAQTDNFSKSSKSAENAVGSFGKKAESSFSGVATALDTVMRAAPAAAFGGIIKSFSSAGAQLEQTEIAFRTFLGGSQEATDKLVGSLNNLANVTPFTNDQVLKAGKSMLAFGANADDVTDILRRVGDVSAGTGKDFNELSVIFGKAMTAGTIYAEDLNQLTEAGIPIIKQFAKQFNVAEADIKKMASEGKIGFSDLDEAFKQMTGEGGLFFNLMEEQSKSFGGRISTLQGTLGSFAAQFGKSINTVLGPALDVMIVGATKLLETFSSLSEPMKTYIAALVLIGGAAAVMIPLWPTLTAGVTAFGAALNAAFIANPVGIVIAAIVVALGSLLAIGNKLYSEWEKFEKLFGMVGDQLRQAGKDALDFIMSFDTVKFIIRSVQELWKWITDTAEAVRKWIMELPMVQKIVDMFNEISDFFSSGSDDIDIFATAIKAAFFGIGVVVQKVISHFQILGQMFAMLGRAGKEFFGSFTVIFTEFQRMVDEGVSAWAAGGGPGRIKDAFKNGIDGAGKELEKGMANIKSIMQKTDQAIADQAKEVLTKNENNLVNAGEKAGESLGKGVVSGADKELEKLKKQFAELGQGWDAKGIGEKVGKQFAEGMFDQSTKEGVEQSIKFSQEVGRAFEMAIQQAAQLAQKALDTFFTIMENRLQKARGQFSLFADVFEMRWSEAVDAQIKKFEDGEDAKIEALRSASDERIRILNEEAAKAMAINDEMLRSKMDTLDAEHQLFLDNIEKERQRKLEELRASTDDALQLQIDTAIINEDAKRQQEEEERRYNDAIEEARKESADSAQDINQKTQEAIKAEEDKTAAKIDAIEENKAAKLEEMNKRKEAESKRHAKIRAAIEYQFEMAAFRVAQQRAVAQATMEFALASLNAISAGLSFLVLAPIMIPLFLGMATAGFALSLSAIASTPPPLPPAALFAADGGKIVGPSHAQGGVMVNAEGGEAFLSRGLTANLESFLTGGGGTTVSFAAGAIVVQGSMDSEMVDRLSDAIAKKVEQRRF